jgi:hypothetical protein
MGQILKRANQTRMVALALGAIFIVLLSSSSSPVSAATQVVTATPGYINLGMTTSIAVIAPAPGTYTVVVQKPSGASVQLALTFTSAGQSQNATFGSAASGFQAVVDQVGTYNVQVLQGAQVVSSTSFYSTNKLVINMDMVTGGTCAFVSGVTRGAKMFPRIYVTFASNGALVTNNTKGVSVTFTNPDKTMTNAAWHGPNFFIGDVLPNWNATYVGAWNPTVTAGDAAGNTGTFQYQGIPFVISPAQLSTNVQLLDAKTGQAVTGLYNGQSLGILATVTYPASAEPVTGFVAPLDSSTRGGSVTALVGWGFYNATSRSFGGKNPGGLIANVPMTYAGSNGVWTGKFNATSLPALQPGTNYEVIVSSTDKASPPNAGSATLNLSPATVQTATATATAVSTAISTTISTTTQTVTQSVETIPTWAYAAMALLLVVGLAIGYVAKRPKQ